MGVQGSHAERAVARRSVGPGADLIGLASSPPPMLHLGVRALFIFLFMSVPFLLLSPFKQLRLGSGQGQGRTAGVHIRYRDLTGVRARAREDFFLYKTLINT